MLMEAAIASASRLLGQLRESAAFTSYLELLLALRRRIELHPLAPQLSHLYHAREGQGRRDAAFLLYILC